MSLGSILYGGPSILSLSIAFNWENSYAFHYSQYVWLFNLSLALLPVSVNPENRIIFSIDCEIFLGLGSKYLGISSSLPTLNKIWFNFLIWSKWILGIPTLYCVVAVLSGSKERAIVGLSSYWINYRETEISSSASLRVTTGVFLYGKCKPP